jgi:3-oxoacyl-[acyl-carrier protein] reductase
MDLGLKGKKVIVNGGSRGIGRATALTFAEEGADVAVCARNPAALEKIRREIEAFGVRAFAAPCDISDSQQLEDFLNAAHASLEGVDILINNASGFGFADDEQGWKTAIDVDLMGSVRATWQVVPWMEAQGGGAILHISSTSGMEAGSPPAYAAMKAALISHSKTLANELAPKNIRVNCIAPGSIEFAGGFWENAKSENPDFYESIRGSIPFGRLGSDWEVASAVVFVASPRASWIAGATLPVDGVQHKGNL